MTRMTTEELTRRIEHLANTVGEDNTDALEKCIPLVHQGIESNFQQSRASDGMAWPPRKDPKPQHPLLVLSGALKAAATGKGANAIGRVRDGKVLEVGVAKGASGTSLGGVRRHQYGDTTPGILPRPYIGIRDPTLDLCVDVIAESVVKEIVEGLS